MPSSLRRMTLWMTLLLGVASLLVAGTASAIEFPLPTLDTRLHTPNSGQPGAEWDTGGAGGDVLSFNDVTGELHLDAEVFVLNYFDPNDGGCLTDMGSNCTHGFTNNLDLSMDAILDTVTVTSTGFGFFDIDITFITAPGTDITVTDSDSTVVLEAEWAAGTFNGTATTGFTVQGTYNDGSSFGSVGLTGDPTIVGFAQITAGFPYAQLFDSGAGTDFGVKIGELFETVPGTLDALAAAIVTTEDLPSFSIEGQGSVFRLENGSFIVPEPGTGMLMGLGLLIAAAQRRRR